MAIHQQVGADPRNRASTTGTRNLWDHGLQWATAATSSPV
jgi:hypothetical protein